MTDRRNVPLAADEAVAKAVASAWADALEVATIDHDTGFFDLGGDSATVVRVVSVLRGSWPSLKIVDVFANPTVASLASFLSKSVDSSACDSSRRISERDP